MAKIVDKIAALPAGTQYFSLEFFPPKTVAGYRNLQPRLERLAALRPLFVCVTFNSGGTTASKSLELADLCQNTLGLTTCLHLTCTNLDTQVIDWVLTEARKKGIRNILALRGDEVWKEPNSAQPKVELNGTTASNGHVVEEEALPKFSYAVDLIRYIRHTHGDYFCIGAATYPEGHPNPSPEHAGGIQQSPQYDLPFLIEKVRAGADFLMTQLFYDVDRFLSFERLLRDHESSVFGSTLPIIPGLMPIQGWQSFRRTCKLARVGIPASMEEKLTPLKGDDEAVKNLGIEIVSSIIERIQTDIRQYPGGQNAYGFHFYTLNLEKAVVQLLEQSGLIPTVQRNPPVTNGDELHHNNDVLLDKAAQNGHTNGESTTGADGRQRSVSHGPKRGRRRSSVSNRVVVRRPAGSSREPLSEYEVFEDEAGSPKASRDRRPAEAAEEDILAAAEGEGSLGREATWDDFPNGRWGDARSPAYLPTSAYSQHPLMAPSHAIPVWSYPADRGDITSIFQRHLDGSLSCIPWSESNDDAISEETALIKEKLLSLTRKGWWTVASQPAVDSARSSDPVLGWGPKKSGWVWQKPFVEFFLPTPDWIRLRKRLDGLGSEKVTYFAGDINGEFEATDSQTPTPVTWGAFRGREILTPTIIDGLSFKSWRDEAFEIWVEWARLFTKNSPSNQLLREVATEVWLVNVVGHDYIGGEGDGGADLWRILLET